MLKRRSRLLTRYGMAVLGDDKEGAREALAAIEEYNASRPAKPIDRATLRRSLRARARARRDADAGVYLNKDLRYLREETRVPM